MNERPLGDSGSDYPRKVIIAVAVGLIAVVLGLIVYAASDVLMLAFAGVLLAVVLSAPAEALARRTKLPYWVALAVVLILLVSAIGVAGFFMGSRIVGQVTELNRLMPAALTRVRVDLETDETGRWVLEQTAAVRDKIMEMLQRPELLTRASGVVSSTFGVVANIVVVVVFAVFLALGPGEYIEGVVRLFPMGRRVRARVVMAKIGHTLRWWFAGQLMSMATIALLTWIGLLLLGMPLALTLAILAGLMNFIPNFGPILAAVPAVIIALSPTATDADIHPKLALWVVGLYLTVQVMEGSMITPVIQKRAVSLPPALIVIGQVLLGLLVGPLGLVLATPILAAGLVLVKMVYVEDVLGDRKKTSLKPVDERSF